MGVYILLAGVRLLLGEIVPAFRGIAMKLVPDAIPALDCPVFFPYSPNAVILGFITTTIGTIIAMFTLPMFGSDDFTWYANQFLCRRDSRGYLATQLADAEERSLAVLLMVSLLHYCPLC